MRIVKIILFLVLLFPLKGLRAQDSLNHQIGIGLPKLIQHVFTVDPNSYLLNYRNSSLKGIQLRAGLDFYNSNKGTEINYLATKLGFDFVLGDYSKWILYSGLDLTYSKSYDNLLKTDTQRLGGHAFLGIMFHISEHFSISTEPYIFVAKDSFNDEDSFDPSQQDQSWTSFGISGVGFLVVNFHF